MTEWNEMLDQALESYANPPQPAGIEARVLARAAQKSRRRSVLIFVPLATACAAAIVAAVMLLHETPLRPPTNATVTVTNTKGAVAPAFAMQPTPRLAPALHVPRARQRSDASAIVTGIAPVFPAPLPLTAEERRMQALAQDSSVIVQPEPPELAISKLDVQPLKIQLLEQGANDEETQP